MAGHQWRTIQTANENISVWDQLTTAHRDCVLSLRSILTYLPTLTSYLVEDDISGHKNAEALQQISNDMYKRRLHVDVTRLVRRRHSSRHCHHIFVTVGNTQVVLGVGRSSDPGRPARTGRRHAGMTVSVAVSVAARL